ncbi:protein STICHEL [Sesamum angolense]|uniref:Protein STICHEL n=1 Tax=Sesamum angolense TaxID=2727404 RepID=A0AAE1X7U9_9LAMI|nr:protein STICHEL [Sesamum angolense]
MMSTDMGGGGGRGGGGMVAGGGGNIDPSNLHLKKELTQIRKAARVLRDPGTSSSWRSPLNSARSLSKHHYVHHHNNGQVDGNSVVSSSEQFLQAQSNSKNYGSGNVGTEKGNLIGKEKERRVFLYNWRSQKSESERSKQIGEDDVENIKDDGSFSTRDESVDVDSLSDARNGGGNDSKSDTYLSEKYPSAIFKCRNTDFTPSIRRTIKKKSKRSNCSNASLRHHKEKLQKHIILSRYAKNVVEGLPGLGLGREDLVGLVDQSDDTEDYCNSEDLRRASALPPLLARLKNKGSFNDADDEVEDQLDLPGRHGCGIPCYWSRRSTPKSRVGYRSCCSPSLSDTLRRRGSSIFCGSQSVHQRRHHCSSLVSNKRRLGSRTGGQSLVPLLTNSANGQGGSSMGSGNSDDELSTNFEELDLEALSRLDGRRWSNCWSQEGLELVALNGEVHDESSPENARSLSHKYRPMFFDELIGQNIVVQSLMTAVSRGRIAPVYLFQGPRGTGKTSSARIFAAALNCLATEDTKPCGVCRECADFISDKSTCLREVDGSNKKGVAKIKILLKSLSVVHPSAHSQFRVFVVDECHLLPSKTWLTFLQLLEKPLPHVVFILITTDIDNVPRTILSRCQKHLFNKISNSDIVARLSKIADDENLDVESDALELIASNADGSLRDAETMLDQLSLFGKRITISLVNELIGVVSDDKLLDLLELAMSSNATETVIRARELMDSGVDPIVLMSQMATLIVDIIAGTYPNVDGKPDSFFGEETECEVPVSLEKHLRVASERSTWFTATLLQLGSVASLDRTHSGSSRRQSSKVTDEDHVIMLREATAQKQRTDSQLEPEKSASPAKSFPRVAHRNSTSKDNPVQQTEASGFNPNPNQSQFINSEALTASQGDGNGGRTALRCVNPKMLTNIWLLCIEKCHSKTLRQLLHTHGRLVSVCEAKGGFVAHVAFGDRNIKARAEGFLSSITNSFELVLQRNVDVKIIILPDTLLQKQTDKKYCNAPGKQIIALECTHSHQMKPFDCVTGNATMSASKESKSGIPVKRIESIIHEQRLETAWLQAMEKGTPGSMSHLKPERNQVLPQDGTYPPNQLEAMNSTDASVQHWEDELNHEIKALKISDGVEPQKDQIGRRIEHYPISPSLLHNSSFASNFSKENIILYLGYRNWDMSLDRRPEVAGGCSVGTTPDLKGGERLNKALLCVRAEVDGSRGSESAQNQGGQTADTTDDRVDRGKHSQGKPKIERVLPFPLDGVMDSFSIEKL